MDVEGGTTRTPSKYITLISSDGFEFVVLREAAMASPTIKTMVNPQSQYKESIAARCLLEELSGVVLGKVVEYFHYWYRFQNDQDVPDMDVPTELCLEILMAADYLGLHP
ncbi:hypothetical protein MAPG_08378 [Magnaporthiopsis poae ATCC 64411]|uniref:Elongin-C n=1 Tax=Magnaporthiopsis poae (strain ATCC 64411 / 73-15) TaxID=644358 RepID=A0A0C4E775_MAGP6|nr:hypothetical protein MAPG_08378 [Magnaporthiopsis poae ATCC 64411]